MNIKEIFRKEVALRPVHFKNDGGDDELPEPLHFNGFFIFSAPPGRGKTTTMLNFFTRKNRFFYKKFDRIYIWSPSLSTADIKIDLPKERFFQDLTMTNLEQVLAAENGSDHRILFIWDDVVASMKKNQAAVLRTIYNRRHLFAGITIMCSTQCYNKIQLEIRKCCSLLFFWRTSNKREIQSVYDDFSLLQRDQFDAVLRHCWKDIHDFCVIDTQRDIYYRNLHKLVFNEEEKKED